jgi:hypothetical protein
LPAFKEESQPDDSVSNADIGHSESRTRKFIIFNNCIIFLSTALTFASNMITARIILDSMAFKSFIPWILIQTIWAFYASGVIIYTSNYFFIIFQALKNKFRKFYNYLKLVIKSNTRIKNSALAIDQQNWEYPKNEETTQSLEYLWIIFLFINYFCFILSFCFAFLNVTIPVNNKFFLIFNLPIIIQSIYIFILIFNSLNILTENANKTVLNKV